MTKPEGDEKLLKDLRAAADRLIAGTALQSSGKLTVSDLAAEAGVKRWVLTHKHPELMHAFQAEFKTLGQVPAPVQAALDQVTQLEKDLAKVRQDKRRLKELVDTYAAIITELTDELIQAQQQRDQALAELDRHRDGVAVLADHRPTRRNNDTFTCS
jgi:chromosome segregation ATPase